MAIATTKLPQNLKVILQEIGEGAALFYLYTHTYHTGWKVLKNVDEVGCDILLHNLQKNKTIKIEVKSRQTLYSTATSKNTKDQRQFELTKTEINSCDFIICYWLDYHAFFIVPTNEIKDKNNFRIVLRKNKKNAFGKAGEKYQNQWNFITDAMAEKELEP